jgi:hypothetical protein
MEVIKGACRRFVTAGTILVAAGLGLMAQPASAAVVHNFTFSGEDKGGVGSATMSLKVDYDAALTKWVLTAVVNNDSPTTTTNGGVNIPGITAFGFELEPLVPWTSWALEGQLYDSATQQMQQVLMAASIPVPNAKWSIDDSHLGNSVELSYIAQVDQAHFGALYNPELAFDGTPPSGGKPKDGPSVYYTEATLTMLFDVEPEFSFFPAGPGNPVAGSPYVRMMRVGDGGSLRLTGVPLIEEPEPGPLPTATPEPSSLLIWAGALAALGLVMHRRRTLPRT